MKCFAAARVFFAALALGLASLALAQVGYPLKSSLAAPDVQALKLKTLPGGDLQSPDGVRLHLVSTGGFLTDASVTLPKLDFAQAGQYLGVLTGFGQDIAQPFADYLAQQQANLTGGVNLTAQQYALTVRTQGEGQSQTLSFTVTLTKLPASAFDSSAHIIGDPKAPIVLREFSDFQCSYCHQFAAQTLPGLLKALPKDARFEYHQFPLESIHPDARPAAEASECAASQGKFWPFADTKWIGTGNTPAALSQVAQSVGLNTAQYASCVAARQGKAAVDAGLVEGERVGVPGTPTLFMNGYLVPDPYNLQDIVRLMALARVSL